MSFADGLMHERQARDAKKRNEIRKLLGRLSEVPFTKTGWQGDVFHGVDVKDKRLAVKYLEEYMNGGQLK